MAMRSYIRPAGVIGSVLLFALLAPALAKQPASAPATQQVEFLDRADAAKAIVDESMEPYFKLLQPMEMSVKTAEPISDGTLDQQRDRCRQRYQKAVEEFTADEQETLRWYVSKLAPLVAEDYPLYAKTPWSFLKLDGKFEGGMPHTRGGHIVLSGGFLAVLIQMHKSAPEAIALARGGDVLLHEQSHVVQRENPAAFARLYTGFWKFKHAAAVQGGDWLTQHQIVNPDGVDINWVFPITEGATTRWIWPLIVFQADDPAHASFGDMRMVAVDIEPAGKNSFKARLGPDGKPQMQYLMSVGEYVSQFRPSGNIYHPNEAAADLFAKVVILDRLMPQIVPAKDAEKLKKPMNALAPLKQWFENVLAEPRP